MKANIRYAYFCHQGLHRPNNEDNYWCCGASLPAIHDGDDQIRFGEISSSDFAVLAVLDGMGGESCGEMASFIGAQRIGELAEAESSLLREDPQAFLQQAADSANKAVLDYQEHHRISTMGSTLAAAAFGEQELCLGNLGDSRIYQFKEDTLQQLSTDHVFGRSMFGKAPLTQYLGLPEEEMVLQPSFVKLPYLGKFDLLLCSDGLSDMVSPAQITEILKQEHPLEEKTAALLQAALNGGGRDNVTAILIHVSAKDISVDTHSSDTDTEKSSFLGWLSRLFKGS
ncbi:MAG: serine/threonine-protein phosphatase [Blautia sp.]|nr:serine/threonine-protein phosphatase [Blautia sp.]